MIVRLDSKDGPPWLKQRSLPCCDRVCLLLPVIGRSRRRSMSCAR